MIKQNLPIIDYQLIDNYCSSNQYIHLKDHNTTHCFIKYLQLKINKISRQKNNDHNLLFFMENIFNGFLSNVLLC